MDKSDKVLDLFENSFKKLDKSVVSTLTAQIGKYIKDFGTKIDQASPSYRKKLILLQSPLRILCPVDVEANLVAAHVSCILL